MNIPVRSEIAAEALKRLLSRLPKGDVSTEWLTSAIEQVLKEVTASHEQSALEATPHLTELDVLSLLDPTNGGDEEAEELMQGLPAINAERYLEPSLLGAGGQGIVHEVTDRFLDRQVAIKALRLELSQNLPSRRSFLREARIVAQLNHAGIVPIHDVGMLPEGAPSYTMRRIRGQSLRQLLTALREATLHRQLERHPEASSERRGKSMAEHRAETAQALLRDFNRRRLIEILVSAAHTVGYAHDRGVVHCDLKPANLMVGDYGEVLVLDWGIARVLGHTTRDVPEGPVVLREEDTEDPRVQVVRGTPGFMAPEQAIGQVQRLGPSTDVYALGLMLYEILVGAPARPPGNTDDVMRLARTGKIEPLESRRRAEGSLTPPIPEELEQLCLKCLSISPESRFADGEALANALQSYLDGEQRRDAAERRASEAEAHLNRLQDLNRLLAQLREEARLLSEAIEPWQEIEHKRRVWAMEDRVRQTEARIDLVHTEAFALYTQALGEDPENGRARAGLARLYHDLLLEAEYWGRLRDSRRYEAQLRQLDDGQYRASLMGQGHCHIETFPSGADITLYEVQEIDRQLKPVCSQAAGQTPLDLVLPMGRYLAVISDPQTARTVSCPIIIRRTGEWHSQVRLYPDIPKDFVLVPGGPFMRGGDRLAPGSPEREDVQVEDFAISIFPVTCAQYLSFLQELAQTDLQDALRRVPRRSGQTGKEPLWPFAPETGFRLPRVDVQGNRWSSELPVRCISRDDAEAFCRWKASRSGFPLRLPTEIEWEKAGRGVDGRFYPWGNQFDASFCKMKDSRPGAPELEPVGAFPQDCSPYGVRDLAGGVIEWVAGPFDRHGVLGIQKGGFWMASQSNCRLARRFGVYPSEPEAFAGFRLAFTPEWG